MIDHAPPPVRPGEWALLAGLLALLALLALVTYSHLGEDAFITYRYARNFALGNGLVYNPGEYVEGYSNLFWLLLVAPFEWLGVRLHVAGRVLSTCFFAGVVVAGWWAGRRLVPAGAPAWVAWWLPVAIALEPFLHYHDDRGLETVPYAALIGGALLVMGAGGSLYLVAGLSALVVWTRPEGILFPMALVPALWWRLREEDGGKATVKALSLAAVPVGAFLLQFLFRRWYYGEWVPNTVIAKRPSGGGLGAVLQYVASHGFVPLFGVAGMAMALWDAPRRVLALGALGLTAAGVLFQVQAGNLLNEGFRYQAPLFVPVVVGCWLLVVRVADWMDLPRSPTGPGLWAAGPVAAVLLLAVPYTPFSPGSRWFRGNTDAPRSRLLVRLGEAETWKIGERLRWYLSDPIFINAEAGRWVAREIPPGAVVGGDQLGQFGFYVGPERVVIDLLGLMDREIARNGLTMEYLRQRNAEYLLIESRTDERFWPREARLMPSVPHLTPIVQSEEFRALYRPRWFLRAPISFSKIGFLVYVRADQHDGAAMEEVSIGVSEQEFERAWRVMEQ